MDMFELFVFADWTLVISNLKSGFQLANMNSKFDLQRWLVLIFLLFKALRHKFWDIFQDVVLSKQSNSDNSLFQLLLIMTWVSSLHLFTFCSSFFCFVSTSSLLFFDFLFFCALFCWFILFRKNNFLWKFSYSFSS